MTDPIADMLIRIKNAQAAQKEAAEVPFSALKFSIAKVLEKTGFIADMELRGKKAKRVIAIRLKYQEAVPGITGTRRVSKPGQRIYRSAEGVRRVKGGRGISILSTSKGIMTDREAKEAHAGGEVLCEVW